MQAQGSLRATARTGDRVTIAVVTCASGDDLRAALTPMWHYFGRVPADDSIAALRRLMPPYRVHTAQDGAHVIGAAGSFAFELTVPGARVPAAGVTIVAVLPTHRRRGALRQMMRVQLDACRERAEPLAYLWAAEDGIYERFGYGIASFSAEIDAPRQGARLRDASSSPPHARLMPPREAQAVIAPIYERVAKATPGMFFRSGAWWQERTLADTPWRRGNSGELQCVIVECDAAQAYALYRLTPSFERGRAHGGRKRRRGDGQLFAGDAGGVALPVGNRLDGAGHRRAAADRPSPAAARSRAATAALQPARWGVVATGRCGGCAHCPPLRAGRTGGDRGGGRLLPLEQRPLARWSRRRPQNHRRRRAALRR